MRVGSNSMVESTVTPGLPSAVASRREGAYVTEGVGVRCLDPSEKQRERRAMLGMGKRKPALELALESFQDKEGKEGGQGKERQ